MVSEFIRRFAYVKLIQLAQRATGFHPHYKAAYGLYLQGARWYVLRNLRLWWDGWTCVRCGRQHPLEVHHLSYDDKGKGLGVREFLALRTLCDDCHAWVHGRK